MVSLSKNKNSYQVKPMNYEIKMSKTGLPVPVIDGVHLHSIYDPMKESKALVSRHIEILKKKANILVLGLGLGHHIIEISKELEKHHHNDFQIFVIEPNQNLIAEVKNKLDLVKLRVHIIHLEGEEQLSRPYTDERLLTFLLLSPGLIAHPPSYNFYMQNFKAFLTYRADQNLQSIAPFIDDANIKEIVKNDMINKTLSDLLIDINQKEKLQSYDLLLMAFDEISGLSRQRTTNHHQETIHE